MALKPRAFDRPANETVFSRRDVSLLVEPFVVAATTKITPCNFFANEETRLVCCILESFFVGLGQARVCFRAKAYSIGMLDGLV